MGEPIGAPAPDPQPVTNAPVGWACDHPAGPVVVRVTDPHDIVRVRDIDPERVPWFEVPLHLVGQPWPDTAALDIVLDDPARQAAGVYDLTRLRGERPLRVTIAGRPGIARAARIAMALQLPVRLMVRQPTPEVLAELHELLEIYLHDSQTTAPVEFLQSLLASCLHRDAPPIWFALEVDPAWFPRIGDAGTHTGAWPPGEPDFVVRWFANLVDTGAECATCRFREWCRGFFKWPDPSYSCAGVIELLARVEQNAVRLARDLDESQALEP